MRTVCTRLIATGLAIWLSGAGGLLASDAPETPSPTDGYTMRLTGEIQPGDDDGMVDAIRERGGFPAGIELDSTGGDLETAMTIGHFVRHAMLPTAGDTLCDGACFLVWVAGVHRRPAAEMDIDLGRLTVEEKERIGNYLFEMEVPEALTIRVLEGSETKFTAEQIGEAVRATAPSYAAWLEETCGGLTIAEFEDLRAIDALEHAEAGEVTTNPEALELRKLARAMPAEYRQSLTDKEQSVLSCQRQAINNARSGLLDR